MNERPIPPGTSDEITPDTPQTEHPGFDIPFSVKQVPSATQRRCYSSADLMGSDREILIEHGGEFYRLRCTKLGKLVLQK
jgi:hemin uptake protein HemP